MKATRFAALLPSRKVFAWRATAPEVAHPVTDGAPPNSGDHAVFAPSAPAPLPVMGTEQKVQLLRALLQVSPNGQSTNMQVLPITKPKQSKVLALFSSMGREPAAFGQLYFRVNRDRLLQALTGPEKGAMRARVAEHDGSARPGDWDGYLRYLDQLTGSRPMGPSAMDFLIDGTEVTPKAMRALSQAKSSIHLSVYQLQPDEVGWRLAKMLAKKAAPPPLGAGVKVRVMVDEHGTMFDGHRRREATALLEFLRASGVEVVVNKMPRMRGHLDHRKLLVIDGKVGFTGGMNIGLRYQRDWHDQQTMIQGPLVAELQRAFVGQWVKEGGRTPERLEPLYPRLEPVAGGYVGRVITHEGHGQDRNLKAAYLRAIHTATTEIRIATPYFGDDEIVSALQSAAARGVRVQLILPEHNHVAVLHRCSQAHFNALLASGVEIYRYPGTSHLKVCTIDRKWVTYGSCNLDARSLEHNDELNCVVIDERLARDVNERLFEVDLKKCTRLAGPEAKLLSIIDRRLTRFL